MKKHFYYLSLALGLAVSMTGFTSCGDDNDDPQTSTTAQDAQQKQEISVIYALSLDVANIDPQFVDQENKCIAITVGESADMKFIVEPAELASQIVLTSSDPSIIEVDGLKLTAKKVGTVKISVKAGEMETAFNVVVKKFVDRDENGNLKISEFNFPDAIFRDYVKQFDTNSDNVLTDAEIAEVTLINFTNKDAISIEGVDFFTALTSLDCGGNQLTSLDVSKNTELTFLACATNKLTSLDVSKNTKLTDLSCGTNQLTSLDVTKNTELIGLSCSSNQLTSLDVTKNTALTSLLCQNNQLTSLDVTKNTALTYLDCSTNQLTSLDVSKNTKLEFLICESNHLTSLDLSNNPEMTSWSLVCDGSVVVDWGVK